jgi:hypothetical protein
MLNLLVDHFGIFRTNDVDYTMLLANLFFIHLRSSKNTNILQQNGGSSYESSKYVLPKFLGGILLYYKTKNS